MTNLSLSTKKIAFLGLMLSIIFILSIFERMLPPIPFLPANFKLGLSNIIIMYSLFFIGKKDTIILTILKSLFNMILSGPVAGFISLSGGAISILSIIIFYFLLRANTSYITLSITGAIFHNIGQLLAASFLLRSFILVYYLPILLVFSIVTGSMTGASLKTIMPIFNKLSLNNI